MEECLVDGGWEREMDEWGEKKRCDEGQSGGETTGNAKERG